MMDKFVVKRKREGETARPEKKVKSAYVFCVAPGASGGDCGELVDILGGLGRVCAVKKWVGNFPSQMKANKELLARTAREGRRGDEKVVLVGHSFGCRVIAELVGDEEFRLAVLESYPLYGPTPPKPATDRAVALRNLPKVPVLFVNGTKDPFLSRDWLPKDAPRGVDALRAVLRDSACDPTVVVVEGAGHNVLKVSKTKQQAARGTLRSAIVAYLEKKDDLEKKDGPQQ